MTLNEVVNIADLRELARRRLPRAVFGFVDGGAHDERTLRDNEDDFSRIRFAPRMLVDVSARKQAIDLFGQTLSSPLIVGPTGIAGIVWPEGDLCLARASAAMGVGFCQSTTSNASIEQVAARGRQGHWFQVYVQKDRALTQSLIDRARDAGCTALVLTVDLPVAGPRERDIRNGFTLPPRIGLANAVDYARKLGWLWRMAGAPRFTFGNLDDPERPRQGLVTLAEQIGRNFDASVSWKDLDWLRGQWPGKLLVKGLLRADDAARALQQGADAVIVSNHGGRQLDGAPSGIAALPPIVDAIGGRIPVLVDGGIRRGSDVVKAVALGATACIVGRAGLYGLAAAGQAGVERAIGILQREIDVVLALLGVPDINQLDRSALFDAPTLRNFLHGATSEADRARTSAGRFAGDLDVQHETSVTTHVRT